ncbi:membrane protein [Salmonella enterica subsp. enterica]|uniref:Membrane protein n=1 Tax=Salmonella enterica I TaxID=59201 RepID=A0A379Y3X1_SALET|nr:membrane protein [Salmonella enterica subsp. enterica]
MSKSKARSKALLLAFADLIPDMDKALNKKLLDSLIIYSGHDNDLIVILNEDGPTIIELNSLKSVSMLAQKLSAFSKYYHVEMQEIHVKPIDFEKAYNLLKEAPAIPMFKTLAELDKFLNEEFEKYGLNTFLDVDDLEYSLEKSRELKNDQLIAWVSEIIVKRDKLALRNRFNEVTKAHYETVDAMYAAVRPLMKELGFPDELMLHTFSELSVFDSKGWDHAIKSKIEFLTKREAQYLDDKMKAEKQQTTIDELMAQINDAKTTKEPRNFGQTFGFAVIGLLAFMFIVNKFI